MTKLLDILFLAALLTPAGCGVASNEAVGTTHDGIAGGTPDPAARSVGYLVEHMPGGSIVEPACTATLVGKRTVVTSAQCVAGPGSTFAVVFDGKKRGVQAVHVRPGFDADDLENGNDLAVLVLDGAIDGVTPATLGETTNGASRIIGHGRTSTTGDGPHERRSVAATQVSDDDGMVRASTSGGSVCTADAGAGFVRDVNGGIEIVALLSFAESDDDSAPMCATGTTAVLTSLMNHLAFIRGIAKETTDEVMTSSGPSAQIPSNPSAVARVTAALAFDASFYGDAYSDLRAAFGHDANALANHWATYGHREGRIATAVFDVGYYLAHEADVAAQTKGDRGATIQHFVDYGGREGRRGSIVFDARYYADHNADLEVFNRDYGALAQHYMTYGILEGRRASADFDPQFFAASTPAIRDVYGATNYRAATLYFLQHQNDGIRGVP